MSKTQSSVENDMTRIEVMGVERVKERLQSDGIATFVLAMIRLLVGRTSD